MDKIKISYLKAIILFDDIKCYHEELNIETNLKKKYRLFKNCFTSLDLLRDALDKFAIYLNDDNKITELSRDLRKKLEFVNHLRNKLSSHLDDTLLGKVVQWEPSIFMSASKENIEFQLTLTYKALIESGINSFLGPNEKQKNFNTEIDLFYPPDQIIFYDHIGELNCLAIEFWGNFIEKLKKLIKYYDEKEIQEIAEIAAETKFNLKN